MCWRRGLCAAMSVKVIPGTGNGTCYAWTHSTLSTKFIMIRKGYPALHRALVFNGRHDKAGSPESCREEDGLFGTLDQVCNSQRWPIRPVPRRFFPSGCGDCGPGAGGRPVHRVAPSPRPIRLTGPAGCPNQRGRHHPPETPVPWRMQFRQRPLATGCTRPKGRPRRSSSRMGPCCGGAASGLRAARWGRSASTPR